MAAVALQRQMVDVIPAGDKKIAITTQCPRRQLAEPKPLLHGDDQGLIIEGFTRGCQDFEDRKDAQELFVAGKVWWHSRWVRSGWGGAIGPALGRPPVVQSSETSRIGERILTGPKLSRFSRHPWSLSTGSPRAATAVRMHPQSRRRHVLVNERLPCGGRAGRHVPPAAAAPLLRARASRHRGRPGPCVLA